MNNNENTNTIQEEWYWIDYLRVFATFGVILLHTAAPLANQYGIVSNYDWWIGNIYNSITRFCVPVFLMISGALIFSKTYNSTNDFLKKRVSKIIVPFLFWSMIYIARGIFFKFRSGEDITIIDVLKFIFLKLVTGASVHLWYVYLIIGLYLFFPIIGKWIHGSSLRDIRYFIIIWIITIFVQLPFINSYFPKINLLYFSGYIGYPILGYFLSKTNGSFWKKNGFQLLFFLIGSLITILGAYFMAIQKTGKYQSFYGYLTPNVLLTSIAIFLLFKNRLSFKSNPPALLLFFSKYSYGIYLVHLLVLWILRMVGISQNFINPIIGIPMTSLWCLVFSALIIWTVNKMPMGKYISG